MTYLYNSLTRKKELLSPIRPPHIGIYVCGLTVYDDCHIGHGRLFIWFDMLVRYLRDIGYEVTYVRNITDIDDKIIKKAHELNIDHRELTDGVIKSMHEDVTALNIISPNFEPRVTDNIPEIIAMIDVLINKGFAYVTPCGDVYYSVEKFSPYGALANRDLHSIQSRLATEQQEEKKNPLDFALWKAAKPDEPYWNSPWGDGRPGWHIECSAMAKKYLGNTLDIHGGGYDLQFPHHQNEIAQSEAANGAPLANCWVHLGFVQNSDEKMSKSLNNFFTLKEVIRNYFPEVLRYFYLTSHYRSPINFSHENMEQAEAALRKLYIATRNLDTSEVLSRDDLRNISPEHHDKFYAAMDDDGNTPQALAVLFELVREINQLRTARNLPAATSLSKLLKKLAGVLGLLQSDPNDFLKYGVAVEAIDALVAKRHEARNTKNWEEADRVRSQLTAMGIALEDTKERTLWFLEDRTKYKNNNLS